MFTDLGKIIFVAGNFLDDEVATPELLAIDMDQVSSDYSFLQKDLEVYDEIWIKKIYGMVGTVLNDILLICGGILPDNENHVSKATNKCHTFSFDSYEWKLSNVSMLNSRVFSQSVMLFNGTFFVTGGIDENNIVLGTTEYLDGNSFSNGPNLHANIAKHCILLLNETHMFMIGGVQSRMRAIPNGKITHVYLKIL